MFYVLDKIQLVSWPQWQCPSVFALLFLLNGCVTKRERGRGRKVKLSQLFGIRTTNQSNQFGNSPVSGVYGSLIKLNNLSEVGMFVPKLSPSILVYLFTELFYKDPSKNISVMKDDHCHCIIVVVSLNVCFLVI